MVLNPNSSQAMTDGMMRAINTTAADLGLPHSTEIHAYTAPAPAAPASIDDDVGIGRSRAAVLDDLRGNDGEWAAAVAAYDGILVACFSVHPLVGELQDPMRRRAVTGIFEASILMALSLLPPPRYHRPPRSYDYVREAGREEDEDEEQWGIVTTGKFWENHLAEGVRAFLGISTSADPYRNSRFAGVESTGLNASDFHSDTVTPDVVRGKLAEATKRLLRGGRTTVILMGCAGMAGLEEIIRGAAAEAVNERFAYEVLHVVDGVRAGLMQIDTVIKNQRLRGGGGRHENESLDS